MGQIYHVWNRGVDGRDIFLDDNDRYRFLLTLGALNTIKHVAIRNLGVVGFLEVEPREKLVAIFAYTLLNNHFHLCLKELRPGGMTKFISKLSTGYTLYFNLKHKRRGRLFERSMQWKIILNDRYFQHLIAYIHLNSLDAYDKKWREGVLCKKEKLDIMRKYQWSSARSYIKNTFDPLIDVNNLNMHYPADYIKNHWKYLSGWSMRYLPEIEPRED
jgi:putative transposase